MNKKLLWTIVSLVVLIVLFVTLKKTGVIGKEDGLTVSAEKAAMRTIIETVNASGKVYPEIEVKVSPDISGEIVELNVNEGDSVTKGQVLARIYADIYSTQRDQVAAGVNQARAQLANSSASIVGLKATLDNAKQVYDRQLKLYNDKVTSRQEFEQAQQAFRSAEANYNGAKEGLKGTQAAISGAEAQLARANKDLSRTTHVFERGSWLSKGKEVTPDVPGVLPALPKNAPKNRMGLAMWLTSTNNPLVARTLVNRLWEQLFGSGIVETLEDLGTQGLFSMATHAHTQLEHQKNTQRNRAFCYL